MINFFNFIYLFIFFYLLTCLHLCRVISSEMHTLQLKVHCRALSTISGGCCGSLRARPWSPSAAWMKMAWNPATHSGPPRKGRKLNMERSSSLSSPAVPMTSSLSGSTYCRKTRYACSGETPYLILFSGVSLYFCSLKQPLPRMKASLWLSFITLSGPSRTVHRQAPS